MKKRVIIIPVVTIAIATPIAVTAARYYDTSSTPPEIKSNAEEWSTSATVSITKDATFGGLDLDYYEYCISDSDTADDCDWKTSSVSSIRVRNSGTSYVWLRAVSKSGVYSEISDYVITKVDREKPSASTTVSTNGSSSITIKVSASDNVEVAKYEYSINGDDYISDGNAHTFTGLAVDTEYTIKVKVSDPAGNTKYLTVKKTIESSTKTTGIAFAQNNRSGTHSKTSSKTPQVKTASFGRGGEEKREKPSKERPSSTKPEKPTKTADSADDAEPTASDSIDTEEDEDIKTCPVEKDTSESNTELDTETETDTESISSECLADDESEDEEKDLDDATEETPAIINPVTDITEDTDKVETFSDFSA